MSEIQFGKLPTRKGINFGRVVATTRTDDVLQAPFPTLRTILWTTQKNLPPGQTQQESPSDFAFVVTQDVLLATNRHVKQSLDRELGGFLLGNAYRCPNTGRQYVMIDQYLEADYTEGTSVSLNFTNESWGQLSELLSGKFLGKHLVGWYHSHPRMNVFLSEHDKVIHHERFKEPWQTALVIEPEKHFGGFFGWRDGHLDLNTCIDFYELLGGNARTSVLAWGNHQGFDLQHNRPPTLGKVNTRTDATRADGNNAAPVNVAPPTWKDALPKSLRGPRLWAALAGVALVAGLLTVFAATKLFSKKTTATTDFDPAALQALNGITFKVREKDAEIDPKAKRLSIKADMQQVPEEIRNSPEGYISLSFAGKDMMLEAQPNGNNLALAATLENADDIIRQLKGTSSGIEYLITARVDYGGTTRNFNNEVAFSGIKPDTPDTKPISVAVKVKSSNETAPVPMTQAQKDEREQRNKTNAETRNNTTAPRSAQPVKNKDTSRTGRNNDFNDDREEEALTPAPPPPPPPPATNGLTRSQRAKPANNKLPQADTLDDLLADEGARDTDVNNARDAVKKAKTQADRAAAQIILEKATRERADATKKREDFQRQGNKQDNKQGPKDQ